MRDGDYTPVKEDYYGGIGDYPDLGDINYDVKDPYENWSYEKYRRNFTEPVNNPEFIFYSLIILIIFL